MVTGGYKIKRKTDNSIKHSLCWGSQFISCLKFLVSLHRPELRTARKVSLSTHASCVARQVGYWIVVTKGKKSPKINTPTDTHTHTRSGVYLHYFAAHWLSRRRDLQRWLWWNSTAERKAADLPVTPQGYCCKHEPLQWKTLQCAASDSLSLSLPVSRSLALSLSLSPHRATSLKAPWPSHTSNEWVLSILCRWRIKLCDK